MNKAPIPFIDPEAFRRARILLRDAELLVRVEEPGGMLGPSGLAYGLGGFLGRLFVPADRLGEAHEILERAGLNVHIGLPIVDREHPKCPHCNAALDVDGPETCEACGTVFQWVDIEEPEIDPTGHTCAECGYELTGNTTGLCPECGAPLPADVVALAEAALGRESADTSETPLSHSQTRRLVEWTLLVLGIVVLIVLFARLATE